MIRQLPRTEMTPAQAARAVSIRMRTGSMIFDAMCMQKDVAADEKRTIIFSFQST